MSHRSNFYNFRGKKNNKLWNFKELKIDHFKHFCAKFRILTFSLGCNLSEKVGINQNVEILRELRTSVKLIFCAKFQIDQNVAIWVKKV